MLTKLRSRLTFANTVALIALFIALGGTSVAAVALTKGSVKGKHIAKNAVTTSKVKDGSLRARDFPATELPKGDKGEKGDKGDPGQPGPSAAVGAITSRGITKTGFVANGTELETAECMPGERATGGGVRVNALGYSSYRIVLSHPNGQPATSWTGAVHSSVTKADAQMRVFVLCVA
jgi:hypothetical protein